MASSPLRRYESPEAIPITENQKTNSFPKSGTFADHRGSCPELQGCMCKFNHLWQKGLDINLVWTLGLSDPGIAFAKPIMSIYRKRSSIQREPCPDKTIILLIPCCGPAAAGSVDSICASDGGPRFCYSTPRLGVHPDIYFQLGVPGASDGGCAARPQL